MLATRKILPPGHDQGNEAAITAQAQQLHEEASLWEAVRRAHAATRYRRLGDDPDARRALREWETVFLGKDSERPAGVVVPFARPRR
jgi:hypothetical protein